MVSKESQFLSLLAEEMSKLHGGCNVRKALSVIDTEEHSYIIGSFDDETVPSAVLGRVLSKLTKGEPSVGRLSVLKHREKTCSCFKYDRTKAA